MRNRRFELSELRAPIVQAPMAGGPSTRELAVAVCRAGGLGFLAAGYRPAQAVREDIDAVRAATGGPFGVNLFVPAAEPADPARLRDYLRELAPEAERQRVQLGEPRSDDDGWQAKLELVCEKQVPVVSFTFGCPAADEIGRLHAAGSAAWITVTSPDEARLAQDAGADALVVQGTEAGGHRGGFVDDRRFDGLGLLALLRLVARSASAPLIASGGISDGAAIAAVLCAGASAAQIGTAFMLCPEAGTVDSHRALLTQPVPTALTRAFTGRLARGLVNRFLADHTATAPIAYPEIHHATAPLRAAARKRGDTDGFNLWAGQTHELAQPLPAGELVRRLVADARRTLDWEGRRRPI
ncbi:MAG: NAD(P)H-dependent flavin oxidoreductase [Solirubrobacteraceae bacterium]